MTDISNNSQPYNGNNVSQITEFETKKESLNALKQINLL